MNRLCKYEMEIIMMKLNKILLVGIMVLSSMLTACNKQVLDFTYSYEYAIIKLPDDTVIEGKVQSWKDYDGEQLQIVIDDNTYLVNSVNAVMMKHH